MTQEQGGKETVPAYEKEFAAYVDFVRQNGGAADASLEYGPRVGYLRQMYYRAAGHQSTVNGTEGVI